MRLTKNNLKRHINLINELIMKRLVKLSLVLSCTALLLSSCNCFNGIQKNINRVEVKSAPSVLSLQGSNVTTDLTVTFPPKYFKKGAIMKVTPVLVFTGGEIAGTPKFLQGESVKGNYTAISYKQGGSYTQTVTFPYDDRAKLSKLELRMEATCFSRCPEQERPFQALSSPITVAAGISTIQRNAAWSDYMSYMADNLKPITTTTKEGEVLFPINKADARSIQLTPDQVRKLETFIKENEGAAIMSVGYASPEGPEKGNERLAGQRGKTGADAFSKALNNSGVKIEDGILSPYGEDWDGFREKVQASNIRDKELILQVLKMYDSSTRRETEIRNMASVFKVLAEEILPQLRRAELVSSIDLKPKSDAELKAAVSSNLNAMNIEEMLRAATLYNDLADKARIYKAAADKHKDARAYNNLGVVLAQQGKFNESKSALEQAAKIKAATETSNNMGAVALAEGDVASAKRYISSLNSADANRNKALINLAEGDYSAASKDLNGYNLAVAQVLNGNLAAAKSALNGVTTANADYLRAQIAMREGDRTAAMANLKSACQKDSSLKAKAKQDVEFAKLFDSPEFQSL